MPVIPALGKVRREDCWESEASLGYTMRICLKEKNKTKIYLNASVLEVRISYIFKYFLIDIMNYIMEYIQNSNSLNKICSISYLHKKMSVFLTQSYMNWVIANKWTYSCVNYLRAKRPSPPRALHLGTLAKALERNSTGTAHQCLSAILWMNFNKKRPGRKGLETLLLQGSCGKVLCFLSQ